MCIGFHGCKLYFEMMVNVIVSSETLVVCNLKHWMFLGDLILKPHKILYAPVSISTSFLCKQQMCSQRTAER